MPQRMVVKFRALRAGRPFLDRAVLAAGMSALSLALTGIVVLYG